jgi:3-mercaptopyruvate sulfurtransferase SseA
MPGARNRKFPIYLMLLGGGLILGALAWAAYRFSQPSAPQQPAVVDEDSYPEIPRIPLEQAKAAYDLGSAVFVDVRDAESYAQSHIAGAISIPLIELPDRMDELDPQAQIFTY